ncbi:MAG TPA: hypothetical protein VES67_16495 [Vicinamibacterales bacterium]|nr:hypothetical protein [Vicinamibacterales bacterium]
MTFRFLTRSAAYEFVALLLLGGTFAATFRADRLEARQSGGLKVVEVNEPEGQILSYRHLASSTEVLMRGTRLAPDARVKLKVGSRPGFVELDINRGGITGLKPAHRLGRDFLTYVLWAVSVDGRASNLGEITFDGEAAVAVNLTTPYQTFWLMATAEPNFAVVDPSSRIVLFSVKHVDASNSRAIPITGKLFYFTHYSVYESTPGDAPAGVPNQLLQARKAVELASHSTLLTAPQLEIGLKEEQYIREALAQARAFLRRAEEAFKQDPRRADVIQFARTAAQSAENARALALGAVGGVVARQLETELIKLREELVSLKTGEPGVARRPANAEAIVPGLRPGSLPGSLPGSPPPGSPPGSPVSPPVSPLIKQPALWFAVGGWGLAIVLLFRRRSL